MAAIKLGWEELDTVESMLTHKHEQIKINATCACTLCSLARDVLSTKETIKGENAVKILTLIKKTHTRFGQCDVELLKSLFNDCFKSTTTSSE